MELRQALLAPGDAAFELDDGLVDVLALRLEGDDALAPLLDRELELGGAAVLPVVEFENVANLREAEADALALEDQLEAGAVAVGVDAVQALPARAEQTLVLVEAERARGDLELNAEVPDRVGPLRSTQFSYVHRCLLPDRQPYAYVHGRQALCVARGGRRP
jgi:hypothetical protein